jgi:hypothetical protein
MIPIEKVIADRGHNDGETFEKRDHVNGEIPKSVGIRKHCNNKGEIDEGTNKKIGDGNLKRIAGEKAENENECETRGALKNEERIGSHEIGLSASAENEFVDKNHNER